MNRSSWISISAALTCNALLVAQSQASPGDHVIAGEVVCDNEYAIFTASDEEPGMAVSYTGFTDCWYGVIPVAITTPDRFLYIACWSDSGAAQGLMHDLRVDGDPAFSDDPRWGVTPTGTAFQVCIGAPPVALITAMDATIPAPPNGWVPPALGCANPVSGGNACYGLWGHVPLIDVGVRWSWYDSGNQASANAPFQPGFNHGEFLIFRLDMEPEAGTPYCFGDGTNGPCPCANPGDPGHGCANSTFASGARLRGFGDNNPDSVVLSVESARPNSAAVFFVAPPPGSGGTPYRNGLLCVGPFGGIVQSVVTDANGDACTNVLVSAPSGTLPGSGDTRQYQVMYFEPGGGPCGAMATRNLSNAYEIVW